MALLARDLRRAGYQVVNVGYPSRRAPVEELARVVQPAIDTLAARSVERVNFVTHSMGAMLLRAHFATYATQSGPFLGRAVLLGPPNAGSEIVDAWGDKWWFKLANGPAGQQLGTTNDALPKRLPGLPLKFAVIAGESHANPLLPRPAAPHDGKVSVASTHLAGEDAHLVLPINHTWLPTHPEVRRRVKHYLSSGQL
jgi:triacylglycerol lipase